MILTNLPRHIGFHPFTLLLLMLIRRINLLFSKLNIDTNGVKSKWIRFSLV